MKRFLAPLMRLAILTIQIILLICQKSDISLSGIQSKKLRDRIRMLPLTNCLRLAILTLTFASSMTSVPAIADEPDAKSIPKPMLMLGLFCYSSLSTLKPPFEANPSALPWRASGSRKEAIQIMMQKLDPTDAAYEKAIRDQAISASEAKFIKFSAVHESEQWLKNINVSCAAPNLALKDYEACLKETNSEVYKCYRQTIDAVQAASKSSAIK